MSTQTLSVSQFVRDARPCAGGRVSLTLKPGDGGETPPADMAEAWERSVNGLYLEWILKALKLPLPDAVRAARREHRVGELVRFHKSQGLPISEADMRSEKWRDPLADYAHCVRSLVPNPFRDERAVRVPSTVPPSRGSDEAPDQESEGEQGERE